MIELTEEQRQAVDRGELVRATLGHQEVVLLRSDIYFYCAISPLRLKLLSSIRSISTPSKYPSP